MSRPVALAPEHRQRSLLLGAVARSHFDNLTPTQKNWLHNAFMSILVAFSGACEVGGASCTEISTEVDFVKTFEYRDTWTRVRFTQSTYTVRVISFEIIPQGPGGGGTKIAVFVPKSRLENRFSYLSRGPSNQNLSRELYRAELDEFLVACHDIMHRLSAALFAPPPFGSSHADDHFAVSSLIERYFRTDVGAISDPPTEALSELSFGRMFYRRIVDRDAIILLKLSRIISSWKSANQYELNPDWIANHLGMLSEQSAEAIRLIFEREFKRTGNYVCRDIAMGIASLRRGRT